MKSSSTLFLTTLLVAGMVGCGGGTPDDQPGLGQVSGKVTLKGAPLANALVEFTPTKKGRQSSGTTNESGEYTLQYTVEAEGAVIGEHTIMVSLVDGEENYEDGDDEGENADTGLPASATDGSLKHTVTEEATTYDIAL